MTPGQLIDMLADVGMLKEESPGVFGWHPTMKKAERFRDLVAKHEREQCAKVCLTEWTTLGQMEAGEAFAAAIRARWQE
jgi:hypothetical protein